MRDQADQLRQLVRRTIQERPSLEPGVPLVVLSGGKEGVGTTTIAIQLVQELAQLGKRAVLVDANPLRPAIATRLGIDARGSLADVLGGNRSAVESLETINESVRLLAGSRTPGTPLEISQESIGRLLTELRVLHAKTDIVILDAGSGMSPWTTELWRAAYQVLLVTTPDTVSLTETYAAVKLSPHAEIDGKLRLIVNYADDYDTTQQLGNRFASTCLRFLGLGVGEAIAVASNAVAITPDQNPVESSRQGNAFKQSVRLLAAEVLSSCLVLTKPNQSKRKVKSQKTFKTTNKTQSVPLR